MREQEEFPSITWITPSAPIFQAPVLIDDRGRARFVNDGEES
jgi:hypothetical protein